MRNICLSKYLRTILIVSFTTPMVGSISSCGKVAQIGPQLGATSALRIDKKNLDLIPVGVAYKEVLTVSGGLPPYNYTLTFGELPTGLQLNSTTGEISGKVPLSEAGKKYQFKIMVTDSASITIENAYAVATAGYGFTIYPELLSRPSPGFKYEMKLSTNGAVPPVTFTYKGQLPNGFELKNDNGSITSGGKPVADNLADTEWPIEIIATDANKVQSTREYKLKIENATPIPPLEILTTTLDDGVAGEAYHRVISARGGLSPYTFSLKSGLLFSGLSLNASTGVISGSIPRTAINQVSTFVVKVVDTQGKTAEQVLSFKANPYAYALTPEELTAVIPEKPYDVKLTTLGASEPVTFSLTGNLPPNLSIENGRLKTSNGGVPIANQNSVWSFTITATDARGVTASRPYTLNVAAAVQPPPLTMVTSSLSDPVAGSPYTAVISVTGGATPYAFSNNGQLLPGLTLNTSTGVISGTVPAANVNLSRNFSISVTDGSGNTVNRSFSLRASPYTFVIGPEDFTPVIPERPYTATLSAIGATAPVTFAVSGQLPPNMRQNGNKIESHSGGVPITSKNTTWSFSISATDANGVQATRPFNLSVADALATPPLTISTVTLSDGVAGEKYTAVISATGGFTPYTFSRVTGTLPAGTTLNPSTGVITGTIPRTELGKTFNFRVGVTDFLGTSVEKDFSIRANTYTYVIAPDEIPAVTPETNFSFGFTAVGATPDVTWSLTGSLPTGLTLSSTLGKLQSTGNGVPASLENTSWPISLTATDKHGVSVSKSFTLTVGPAILVPALQIATTTVPTPTAGSLYAASIIATGGRTPYKFSISGGLLPQGLSINEDTGVISGTMPHNQTGAVYFFIVKVKDADQDEITQIYSGVVSAYSISVVPSTLTNARPSLSYMNAFSAVGGQSPLQWAVHSGTLPQGLSLSQDGLLSGIVSESEAGVTRTFSVKVTDGNSVVAVRSLTLTTTAFPISISTTSLPTAQENSSYSASLASTGGTAPYNYEYTGTLPSGMGMTNLGVLFGTPANGTGSLVGTPYTIQVRSSDSLGLLTAWTPLTLTVGYSVPVVSTSSLSNGIIGSTYTQFLAATGGKAPYTYSVQPGSSLPSGLSLASNGTLSGIPSVSTSCPANQFVVLVTDLAGQSSAGRTLCISIANGVNITTSSIPAIVRNTLYQTTLNAIGGVTPYTWSAFNLPSGLNISSINSSSAQISGLTSDLSIQNTAYVTVSDANGISTTKSFSYNVAEPVTVNTSSLPRAATGLAYSQSLSASGGSTPYSYAISSGKLPTGLSLNTNGTISGIVDNHAAAIDSYAFSVVVTDANGIKSSPHSLSIEVSVPPKILTNSLMTARVGVPYNVNLRRIGGVAPVTWSGSNIPAGLSIDSARGIITGTPTGAGAVSNVQISLTDAKGFSADITLPLTVASSSLTTDFSSGRFSEPCPIGVTAPCEPYAYRVSKLVPSQTTTNYLVYSTNLSTTALGAANGFRIYIARMDNKGRIVSPQQISGGTPTPTTIFLTAPGRVPSLDIADIDNDSFPDIVFSDYSNSRIGVFYGQSALDTNNMPTFTSAQYYSLPASNAFPYKLDIVTNLRPSPGLAYKDILVTSSWDFIGNNATTTRMNVFLSQCTTSSCNRSTLFSSASHLPTTSAGDIRYNTIMAAGKFSSSNNCRDLVIAGTHSTGSSWLLIRRQDTSGSTCLGTFSTAPITFNYGNTPFPSDIAVRDFNNDGIDDIAVVFSRWGDARIHFMSNNPIAISSSFGIDYLSVPLPHWGATIQPYCSNGTDSCSHPGLLVTGGQRGGFTWPVNNAAYSAAYLMWPNQFGFLSFLPNSGSGTFFEHNAFSTRVDYSIPNGIDTKPSLTPIIGSSPQYNDVVIMGLSTESGGTIQQYASWLLTLPNNNGSTSYPFRVARMAKSLPDAFPNNSAVGTLRVRDMNNDGYPDIIAHLPDQAGLSIAYGSSSDSLISPPAPSFIATGAMHGYPKNWNMDSTLEIDDLNNDGLLDIVTTGYLGRTLSVSFATSSAGDYMDPSMFTLGSGDVRPTAVTTGDLNNDGKRDIVVAIETVSATTQMSLLFLPGKANREFGAIQTIASGNGAMNNCGDVRAIETHDLDRDGNDEVVMLCYGNSASIYAFRRHTDGTWKMNNTTGAYNLFGASNGTAFAIGQLTPGDACYSVGNDFAGQPCVDIVTANLDTANSVRVYSNVTMGKPEPDGTFNLVATNQTSLSLKGFTHDISIADFNRDGYPEIAAMTATSQYSGGYPAGGGALYVLQGTGLANAPVGTVEGWGAESYLGRNIWVDDLNLDGRPDVIGSYHALRLVNPQRIISRFLNSSF